MTCRRLPLAVLLAALLGTAACSHYQLGTAGRLAFTSLYVEPPDMRALVPEAQPVIGRAVRTAFIHDGRVALTDSATDADATLRLIVRDYHRDVATVRPDDTGLARKFRITLGADATLIDNRTGKVLFKDRRLVAQRDIFTDSGQLQAEYQILPLLAQDLADQA
ncbi:MAG: LPS assembly lipoprotein LptE, partial [Opitutales bacterium]